MPESLSHLLMWTVPLAPLAAAVIIALLGPKLLRGASHVVCWAGLGASFAASLALLLTIVPAGFVPDGATPVIASGYQWLSVGGVDIRFDLRADAMSAVMLAMVTGVSLLVAIFGSGYMHHDTGYPRFFAAVSLFVFSMCMLVLAGSFLLLFVFWEAVGLCSYLLIGFWFSRESAAAAAKKAFVVNRIGDFGLIAAMFLIWTTFGSLDFATVLNQRAEDWPIIIGANRGAITLICLLLFLGAMGKSAQFPLHVWLPDAMEGPTPVSALIHAATMVTAGVYLVARCTPLFVWAPTAQLVVSGIGAATALIAALTALTQTDLKRVMAYSTVSQLGYMFMALGAAAAGGDYVTPAVVAAMFHLFTHAYFKALLFLASGSVMHSMGDVIDMRRFSGLRRALPITHWTFLVGAAALAGVPPLSGFFSKDDILAALANGMAHGDYRVFFTGVFAVACFTAVLTAFYTFRAYFMTFWGPEKFPPEAGSHPHDAPPAMAIPLRILAVLALGIGFVVGPLSHAFGGYLSFTWGLSELEPHLHWGLMLFSTLLCAAGIAAAYVMYVQSPGKAADVQRAAGPLYDASLGKFYFDELFTAAIVRPLRKLADVAVVFDKQVIDRAVDSLGRLPLAISRWPRTLHSGLVSNYGAVMLAGAAAGAAFIVRILAGGE